MIIISSKQVILHFIGFITVIAYNCNTLLETILGRLDLHLKGIGARNSVKEVPFDFLSEDLVVTKAPPVTKRLAVDITGAGWKSSYDVVGNERVLRKVVQIHAIHSVDWDNIVQKSEDSWKYSPKCNGKQNIYLLI